MKAIKQMVALSLKDEIETVKILEENKMFFKFSLVKLFASDSC